MFNHRTKAVIKREVKSQIMTKAFIFITILMPLIMFGFMAFQIFITTFEGSESVNLIIVDENGTVNNELKKELDEESYVRDGQYIITYENINEGEFDNYLESVKKDIIDKKITGIVHIPKTVVEKKELNFYSANPGNFNLLNNIRGSINTVLLKNHFAEKDVSEDDLKFATRRVSFETVRVSESGVEKEGFANKIVAFIFTFLLFFSIVLIGQQLMLGVTEEKNNRVVELLLSSLKPGELMTGKIVGTAATGLSQMLIWTLPVILLSAGSFASFGPMADVNLQLGIGHGVYFFFNYLIGLSTYLCLYAGFGSIFDNPQDAQQGIWPLMILILTPFYTAFTLVKNPDNIIATVSSMLPFTSIMVMPARSVMIDVPAWQIIVAILVNVSVLILILKLVAKVYRIGILTTGKKPSWKEIGQWLKYDY